MRVILIAKTEIVNCVPEYQEHELGELSCDCLGGVSAADELAEMAGRLCYLSWDRPNPATATNQGYLENIISQQHFSVLEHASATFYIDGVSRNFTHELIRHRHLSFSEVSQRYVDVSTFPFVVHPGLQKIWEMDTAPDSEYGWNVGEEFLSEHESAVESYDIAMAAFSKLSTPRKEARQAARHILPGGLETKILVSGNMRAWREVLQKRLSPTADAEFREVAKEVLKILRQLSPNTFQDFPEE